MSKIVPALFAFATLAAVGGQASAQPAAAPNGAAGPGSCGQYMYWHGGKCLDARSPPGGPAWSDEMLAKKWAG